MTKQQRGVRALVNEELLSRYRAISEKTGVPLSRLIESAMLCMVDRLEAWGSSLQSLELNMKMSEAATKVKFSPDKRKK